jgi:hypothetical protein
MASRKKVPDTTQEIKEVPSIEQPEKEKPATEQKTKELPKVGNPENTVTIGGKLIEIKPTKLKYQRNKTALFYKVLDIYPVADILAMEAGTFGDDRDGDKALMDWLIAVTDDPDLIVENYDEIDSGVIETLLTIYRRLNKVDEKEAKLKNVAKERKEVA